MVIEEEGQHMAGPRRSAAPGPDPLPWGVQSRLQEFQMEYGVMKFFRRFQKSKMSSPPTETMQSLSLGYFKTLQEDNQVWDKRIAAQTIAHWGNIPKYLWPKCGLLMLSHGPEDPVWDMWCKLEITGKHPYIIYSKNCF